MERPKCFSEYLRKVKENWGRCKKCRHSLACYRKSKGVKNA